MIADTIDHFFQLCKDPVITGQEIRTVSRVGDAFNVVVSEPVNHDPCVVGWCVVVQDGPILMMCWPFPSDCLLQILHDLQVQMSVDALSIGDPLAINHSLSVKKRMSMAFSVDCSILTLVGL